MRAAWRNLCLLLLVGLAPQLGCHQLPKDTRVQDLRPIQQPDATPQQLTAADVGESLAAQARALEDAQKLAEAVAVYEKMRQTDPVPATRKLASLYLKYNELDRAERELQLLWQNNAKDADTLCGLGDVGYRRGHLGIAQKWYSDALSRQPDHPQALSGLGMTLALNSNPDGGFAAFKKMGLTDGEAYCQVASLLKGQKRNEEAMRYYQAALNRDPDNPRARSELAQLYQDDPGLVARIMTRTSAKRGTVEVEPVAMTPMTEPMERRMEQRPSLPPLPDFDLGEDNGRGWKTSGQK